MLAPRVPFPPTYGAAQRNLQILRWLGARHQVTFIAYGNPGDRIASLALAESAEKVVILPPPRRQALRRILDLATSIQPDLARRLWSPAMVDAVERVLGESTFDLVQVEGLEMFSIWRSACAARRSTPAVILDEHNAEFALQTSAAAVSRHDGAWLGALYSSVQAARLRRYERNACGLVDGIVTVSTDDEAALRAIRPDVRAAVVPNGVDLAHYVPEPTYERDQRVLFIGKMDYRPNVDAVEWLCRDIWPIVRREIPSAILDIVGRDPLPRVARLGGADGVTVVGEVPDERIWFQRATLLVVPLRMGSGVRLKVLQAMATGTPIVSTRLGMAGTLAIAGTHYLPGETPKEITNQIVLALRDRGRRVGLAEASLALVRERYDWQVVLPGLDEFHRRIVGNA
jgi:glycosyltransferase involved in cell wall biosynthesis